MLILHSAVPELPAPVAVSFVLLWLSLHPSHGLDHHRLVTVDGGLEFVFAAVAVP